MDFASENVNALGAFIREWRLRRGFSQEEFGDRVGQSQRHVSFIENGRSRPSRSAVERIVTELDIPARDGNRMLNLLGYASSIKEPDPELDWSEPSS